MCNSGVCFFFQEIDASNLAIDGKYMRFWTCCIRDRDRVVETRMAFSSSSLFYRTRLLLHCY